MFFALRAFFLLVSLKNRRSARCPFTTSRPSGAKCLADALWQSSGNVNCPNAAFGFAENQLREHPRTLVLTKQNGAHQHQMARELDLRADRFRRRSFVSSWHLWESSRRRHVQVGIREGLGTTEAGLMEHKMGSCEDVFWSAATAGGAALYSQPRCPSQHICTPLAGKIWQMCCFILCY